MTLIVFAILEAWEEAAAVAPDVITRQARIVYPKEGTRSNLVRLERAEMFLRALERLGYVVVEKQP